MPRADALIRKGAKHLAAHGVANPKLDARLLLEAVTGLSQADLIGQPDTAVSEDKIRAFHNYLDRRSTGEPVSRLLGSREFYGAAFRISPDVLDPRPDTEHLVSEALQAGRRLNRPLRFLDLGTGSGCVAIAMAREATASRGVAVDVSEAALMVARENAKALGVADRLLFLQSHWFSAVGGRFDLIVSNPPYIPSAQIAGLDREVKDFDPRLALDGGADGLECYRLIAGGAAEHLEAEGVIIVETGHDQAQAVRAIFEAAGFRCCLAYRDYAGHNRGLGFEQSSPAGR
jgi:release factor glutamine methyltransferase